MISYKNTHRQYHKYSEWTDRHYKYKTSTMNGQKNGQASNMNQQTSSASG